MKKIIKNLIPQKYHKQISDFINLYFDGFSLKSYSQEGEDLILRRIFETQQKGFYVDVGAHHPMRFSNTYFFYKQGWQGINIDAMPGSMKLFDRIRPRDINLERAVSNQKTVLTYYIFNEPALNGFSEKISIQRDGLREYKITSTKKIHTYTLKEILDEYLPKSQPIDFLSIDVEGLDFEVLKSNNWDQYAPKVVLVESLKLDLEKMMHNEVYKFLNERGYILYAKTVNTLIFKLKMAD